MTREYRIEIVVHLDDDKDLSGIPDQTPAESVMSIVQSDLQESSFAGRVKNITVVETTTPSVVIAFYSY